MSTKTHKDSIKSYEELLRENSLLKRQLQQTNRLEIPITYQIYCEKCGHSRWGSDAICHNCWHIQKLNIL